MTWFTDQFAAYERQTGDAQKVRSSAMPCLNHYGARLSLS